METALDTLLACSIMVIVTLAAMSGTATTIQPYQLDSSKPYEAKFKAELAEQILLDSGQPSNWGIETDRQVIRFGLALENSHLPYELDMEKIARLDENNNHHLDLKTITSSLAPESRILGISLKPLFEIDASLISQTLNGEEKEYTFHVDVMKSGLPVSASLRSYTVLNDYLIISEAYNISNSIDFSVRLPNSLNGTALLIIFARAEPNVTSFTVLTFKHNMMNEPQRKGTFLKMSLENHVLNVESFDSSIGVDRVRIFTLNYFFNLTRISNREETEFNVPNISNSGPMILVASGSNGSLQFNEWTSQPLLPLNFGLSSSESGSTNTMSYRFIVSIDSTLYECHITLGDVDA